MESISDIRIIGIDEKRPPIIKHKSYIDLFFVLNQKVPVTWCEDFNNLMSRHPNKPRINVADSLYIQAWVRAADEIPSHLQELKEAVITCSEQYIEKIERSVRNASAGADTTSKDNSPQDRLNKIVAALDFDTE